MASEKLRYLNRYSGPEAPLDIMELRKYLPGLGVDALAECIWFRAQYDHWDWISGLDDLTQWIEINNKK